MENSISGIGLDENLNYWEIGPFHGSLPGAMILKLSLDGELIQSCQIETGLLHRGLEKAMELHSWPSALVYCDHLDPEAAVFPELAFCMAAEEILGVQISKRVQWIRLVLCELSRISSHLSFIVKIGKAISAETIVHFVLRDRERVLDLMELLTGARFSINFLRIGGVKFDVSDGFLDRVFEMSELMKVRLKEYNDLLSYNQSFLKRTQGVGRLSGEKALQYGVTGSNLRASGTPFDVRKAHPYLLYDEVDFRVTVLHEQSRSSGGDIHDRFLMRLMEISQSVEILMRVTDVISKEEVQGIKYEQDFRVPEGEAFSRVESPRGLLGCFIQSNGSSHPNRIQFKTPTQSTLAVIPKFISGVRLEDLPLFLASLDLSISEADR